MDRPWGHKELDTTKWLTHTQGTGSVHGSENFRINLPTNYLCACLVTQSSLTPCDPMDCSPLGSSVHEILQAKILEQIVISYFRESSPPKNRNCISCVSFIGRQILYLCATWEAQATVYQWSYWEKFQRWPISPTVAVLFCFSLRCLRVHYNLRNIYWVSIHARTKLGIVMQNWLNMDRAFKEFKMVWGR